MSTLRSGGPMKSMQYERKRKGREVRRASGMSTACTHHEHDRCLGKACMGHGMTITCTCGCGCAERRKK